VLLDQIDHLDGDTFAPIRRTRPHDGTSHTPAPRPGRRDDGLEGFKCDRCKTFVGPTITGGRHRNHCPVCLRAGASTAPTRAIDGAAAAH